MDDVPDAMRWCPDCGGVTLHLWGYVYIKPAGELEQKGFYACICGSAARFLASTTVEEFYGEEILATM